MSLVLQLTVEEMSTVELERRIEMARAKRMVAAMEYAAGQQLKLETERDKVHRKLSNHYDMLAKELDRCDRVIYALEQRVTAIEMLRQEAGLIDEYK